MATAALKRSRRRFLELACICFAVAQLGWFIVPRFSLLIQSEWRARDRIIALGHRESLAKDFVFLAIDENSLKLDNLWPEDLEASPALKAMTPGFPWPRQVYADAIDRILGAGARLVILDLIFDKAKDQDPAFKASLDRHANQVVLASNFSVDAQDPSTPDDDIPTITLPTTTLIDKPENDPRVGYANFWAGANEVVRTSVYSTTTPETIGRPFRSGVPVYLSMAAAAMKQMGKDVPAKGSHEPIFFRFGAANTLPVYSFAALFVPYQWHQLLKDGAALKNKIVMIGPSATRMQDFHETPIGKIPGPVVHINALSAALHGAFYDPSDNWVGNALVCAAALLALAIAWKFQRVPVFAFFSLLGATVIYIGFVYLISNEFDYLLQILQPTIVLLLAGTSCISWNFAQTRRESGRMRSTLERYVSRNVVREILDNQEDFLSALGGTRRPMTVFFSDVRGFTSFAEKEDAHSIVEQLNEYLGQMVGIIFRHHGTVDKFMGDGIMAVWGNVVSEGVAKDAARAVAAALEMLTQLGTLNETWTKRGLKPFAIGIGLHHGEAVFGNIGSSEKMEPTVIGDTVNLASRVEGLTKKYGTTLCITQPLAELVADQFLFRSVDLVQVVGKSRPIEILTVIGRRDLEMPDWIKCYEGAIADFRARRFAEAAAELRLCLEAMPDDKLTRIYLERTAAFIANPPPEDWNGAEIATSK